MFNCSAPVWLALGHSPTRVAMAAAFTGEQAAQLAGLLHIAQAAGLLQAGGPLQGAPSGQVSQPSAEPGQPSPVAPAAKWKPEIRYMSDRGSSTQTTQQWDDIIHCYPATTWKQEHRGIPANERLQEWIDLPLHMGLRHPSENTRHVIVSCYLLANRSDPKVAGMSSIQKTAMQELVKDACTQKVRKEGRLKCLVALPPNPVELAKHAEEFAQNQSTKDLLSVMAMGLPVRCPFSAIEVKEVSVSFQTRLTKQQQSAASACPSTSDTSSIMQMQMMQMQMMHTAMQALGVNNGFSGKLSGRRLCEGSAGKMAFGGGLHALGDEAPAREPTAPQPQQEAEEGAEEAPTPAAPGAAHQTQTPQAAALDLIEALRKRPGQPKAGAKAKAKAKAKSKAKAKATAKGSSAAAASPTKPTKKDSRPACPKEGEKVEHRGATIRLKGGKLYLRVPRLLTKEKRSEWTVERVVGSNIAQSFASALDKLEEMVHV